MSTIIDGFREAFHLLFSLNAELVEVVWLSVWVSLLAILLARAFESQQAGLTAKWIVLAALLTAIYGALDEWHQYYTPRRSAGWDDMIANAIGAVVAAPLWILVAKYVPRLRWTKRE